jgi:hypothetical protein
MDHFAQAPIEKSSGDIGGERNDRGGRRLTHDRIC